VNPFNKLSVRASMVLFAGIALSALLGLTLLALTNMHASEALAQRLLGDVQLARAAGNADMMHDALRADALKAQAAGAKARGEDKQAIEKDLAEHIATFDKALAEVEANGSALVRESLSVVKIDVLAYQAGARALVKSALYSKTDEATQKTFDTGFAKLETSLEKLSGLVEAGASASNDEKTAIYGRTRALLVAAAVLAAVLIAACAGLFARNLRAWLASPRPTAWPVRC
jgi:methyl-accepting chemotaxis protein